MVGKRPGRPRTKGTNRINSVQLTPELYKWLERRAEGNYRGMSNEIRAILEEVKAREDK